MALALGVEPVLFLLVVGLLFLPGHVAVSCLGDVELVRLHAPAGDGPGRLALDFAVSLALLTLGAAPVFLFSLPIDGARLGLAAVYAVVGLSSVVTVLNGKGPPSWMRRDGHDWSLWAAFGVSTAILVPAVLIYAGGTIDDWWDLAVVREWSEVYRAPLTESFLGTGLQHPRWSWNSWLFAQALASRWSGAEGWTFQALWLAPMIAALVVSANAFLASSVFREGRRAVLFSILAVPLWVWGTEAIPFFVRLHQDKFVAALVLVPVLLGTTLRELRQRRWQSLLLLAAAVLACLSVHLLIFTMGAVAAVVVAVGRGGDAGRSGLVGASDGLREAFPRVLPLLALACLYPLWQGLRLGPLFAEQGISLADPSNPVVNAHLWLGRLIAPSSPFYIVDPRAVFGSIGLLALLGVVGLGRVGWAGSLIQGSADRLSRVMRVDRDERVLAWLSLVPCLLIFTPGLAALSGFVWVPWMIYRLGWLVPVPLLLGRLLERAYEAGPVGGWRLPAFARSLDGSGESESACIPRPIFLATLSLCAVIVAFTGQDRVARDMSVHPFVGGSREKAPQGALTAAYRFLDERAEPGAVIAPEGFSTLVPALTGRRVLAFSERGTLVFSPSETEAYRRLVDRARFFSTAGTPGERAEIASRYDAAFAVFPRRWATPGDEPRWLESGTGFGFVASDPGGASTPWSDAASLHRQLPERWRVVWQNESFWVVRTRGTAVAPEAIDEGRSRWFEVAGASAPSEVTELPRGLDIVSGGPAGPREFFAALRERRRGEVVASTVGSPGALISLDPAPLAFGVSDKLLWTTPGAIWDDLGAEASIELEIEGRCRIDAVEIVPYSPRGTREVLELKVEGSRVVASAVHRVPIRLELKSQRRQKVRVEVRSVLGNPLRLASVWLFGDARDCDQPTARLTASELVQERAMLAPLLDLVRNYPHSARPLIAVARHRYDEDPDGSEDDVLNLLERALQADPESTVAWLEYGQALDRGGRFDEAVTAYEQGLSLDSNNAWARGVVSWARYRQGSKIRALYHAVYAHEADGQYSDALTIIAHVAEDWGLSKIADRIVDHAHGLDPWRNWPVLAASSFAARRGQPQLARSILTDFLELRPADRDVRARLEFLDASPPTTPPSLGAKSGGGA